MYASCQTESLIVSIRCTTAARQLTTYYHTSPGSRLVWQGSRKRAWDLKMPSFQETRHSILASCLLPLIPKQLSLETDSTLDM